MNSPTDIKLLNSVNHFLAELNNKDTVEEVVQLFLSVTEEFGIHHFTCVNMAAPGRPFRPTEIGGTFDNPYIKHYFDNNLAEKDQTPFFGLRVGRPFLWSEQLDLPTTSKGHIEVVRQAFDFNLREGLVVPLPGYGDILDFFVMAGTEKFSPTPHQIKLFQMLATWAHGRLMTILGDHDIIVEQPQLTGREFECLCHMAADRHVKEISYRMGIKADQVREHRRAIKSKFGTKTYDSVLLEARRSRIII